jgi:two-component system sensor kinase FixL
MAASIAHELAQPLTSAGSAIDAGIRLMPSLPGAQAVEARRALDLASASVRRGREILKRLRAFVAKGQVRARTEDLESIITDASVLVYPQAQRSGLDIRLHTDPEAQWVKADAVQIQQVLINLVKNALEAMAAARTGTVTVSTAAASPELVAVTVEDSGPGLDADALEHAFAPFHSRKAGGLGIGLSVCRTIVEAHGGTIEVGRAEAGGAAFRFTLPRAEPPPR